jgi:hypothetical protein
VRALVCLLTAIAGCGGAGHPPTARIAFSPAYLPIQDNYMTDLALDGSASRDDIDDPAGTLPLRFRWEIEDPAPKVVAGALDAARVTVRVAAPRAVTVHLTATDGGGDEGHASVRVGVTVPQ